MVIRIAVIAIALCFPLREGHADDYATCLMMVSRQTQVPSGLLLSIKLVESGMALSHLIRRNENGSRDHGIYQINDFWLPHLRKYGFDEGNLQQPCHATLAAAMILRYEYLRNGRSWLRAAAFYHSPEPRRQASYLAKVVKAWQRLSKLRQETG